MPRNLLTARQVHTAVDGNHGDGDGLMLRVRDDRASWVFRFTSLAGKRREMGLGVVVRNNLAEAGRSLTTARDEAEKARRLLREQIDPIEHDRDLREAAQRKLEAAKLAQHAERQTLARCSRAYHERVVEPARSTKHAADWINSLEQHVPAAIWQAPIAEVTAPALLDFFVQIRRSHRETGRRVVQCLCKVYSDAVFRGLATANVAAAAAARLHELGIRREVVSYAALPFPEVPAFMGALRSREGIAARALEFAVLTAARTGEVIGAQWGEFDLGAALCVLPKERMKGGEAHTVYLSPRAVEIVKDAQEYGGESHVFPSPADTAVPLSNMAMLTLLRRMDACKRTTVHGLCRASLSTWANETGAARSEVIEACLAHRETDRGRAAYNRAQFVAERRALLGAWADYCAGKAPAGNVVDLAQHRPAAQNAARTDDSLAFKLQ